MTRRLPDVSIVVPVLDGERTLEACLRSLLALDYPEDRREILVVDNGSRDRTPSILARHAGRIRLLAEARRGPASARNRGLAEARGEVVAFTDADCVVDAGWLRRLVVPLEDRGVAIAGGRILARRPCNAIELFGEEIHDHDRAINLYAPPYAITMSWASPAAVLTGAGGFDEGLPRGEDVDLAYRLVQAGHRIAFVPDAVVYHANERSFAGLFREGFQHGLYSVAVLRKHRAFVAGHGHRRWARGTYAALAARWWRSRRAADRGRDLPPAVFDSGKKLGKIVGSVRFRSLEL
jgi:glycosyltransferase involved in cell wall biosynthesis